MSEIPKLVAKLRDTFDSGHTRPHAWRKQQLKQMKALLREGEDELARALQEDLGKAPIEAWATELNLVSREIDHMLSKLDAWAKPRRVHVPSVELGAPNMGCGFDGRGPPPCPMVRGDGALRGAPSGEPAAVA